MKPKIIPLAVFSSGLILGVFLAVVVQKTSHPIIKHAIDKPSEKTEVNNDINKIKNKKGTTDIKSEVLKDSVRKKRWWRKN